MKLASLLFLIPALALASSLDQGAHSVSMRAVDLAAAYAKNEVDADQRYKNLQVNLGGTVLRVGKDRSDDSPYVLLDGGCRACDPICCKFTDAYAARIAQLQPGNNVGIRGTIVGLKALGVIVKDCSL